MPEINIEVTYGGGTIPLRVANSDPITVATAAAEFVRQVGALSGDQNVTVNDQPAEQDTLLNDSDRLAFMKAAGAKGE